MSAKLERMFREELQINIVLQLVVFSPIFTLLYFVLWDFVHFSYCVILSVRNMSCRIMSGYCTVFLYNKNMF